MAFDPRANQAFVLDQPPPGSAPAGPGTRALRPDGSATNPAIVRIDLEAATCELVLELLRDSSSILLDPHRRRALFVDAFDGPVTRLATFDLDTTEEANLSHVAATLNELAYGSLTVDPTQDRLLTFVEGQGLVAVDVDTGEVEVISEEPTQPDLAPSSLSGMTVDATRNRVIVGNEALDALIAIDLETGAREIVLALDRDNGHPTYSLTPVLDEAHHRAFLLDRELDALLVLDFETGMSAAVAL